MSMHAGLLFHHKKFALSRPLSPMRGFFEKFLWKQYPAQSKHEFMKYQGWKLIIRQGFPLTKLVIGYELRECNICSDSPGGLNYFPGNKRDFLPLFFVLGSFLKVNNAWLYALTPEIRDALNNPRDEQTGSRLII